MTEKDTLQIRPLRPGDAGDLYGIVSHPKVARWLLQVPSMERHETEAWVAQQVNGRHRLVAQRDGRVIGQATVTQRMRARLMHMGTVGLMVHPDAWGQGVGTALMTALLDLADNWLGLRRLELEVFTHNSAAIRLYKRLGFVQEGKRRMVAFGDGRFLDDYVMARLREPVPPSPPVSMPPAPPHRSDKPRATPETVILRPQQRSDAAQLHDLWRHPAIAATTLQLPSQEPARAESRLQERPSGMHRFLAEENGRVLGAISIFQYQNPRMAHAGNLGMMVNPDDWGRGVGSLLMAHVLELADNWLNLRRLELEVHADNPAAVHLYKKFGFEIEGTKVMQNYGNGRWPDTHFMARLQGSV